MTSPVLQLWLYFVSILDLVFRFKSVFGVPACPVLLAQVPCGLVLSPGDGEPEAGLATLWVPREGVPGWGPVVGVKVDGGAEVDLLGGVVEPWGAASRGRGAMPPR